MKGEQAKYVRMVDPRTALRVAVMLFAVCGLILNAAGTASPRWKMMYLYCWSSGSGEACNAETLIFGLGHCSNVDVVRLPFRVSFAGAVIACALSLAAAIAWVMGTRASGHATVLWVAGTLLSALACASGIVCVATFTSAFDRYFGCDMQGECLKGLVPQPPPEMIRSCPGESRSFMIAGIVLQGLAAMAAVVSEMCMNHVPRERCDFGQS